MARVTVEDCLDYTPNRFALARLASIRSYDLVHGARPLVVCDNKEVVTSLREVAARKIDFDRELLMKPRPAELEDEGKHL